MLSILIPIYNVSVCNLVDDLIQQCREAKIDFEIICLDDDSTLEFKEKNREISTKLGVNYVEISSNIGRSEIRNRLCKLARFDWLLYLDCDVQITGNQFIKNYIEQINGPAVYSGGRIYDQNPPGDKELLIHWYYGTIRESLSASERQKNPAMYFHTSNFLVARSVISNIPFDNRIKEYGYEDLELAKRLFEKGQKILHLDNPVLHLGLKDFTTFIKDQKEATKNLSGLYLNDKINKTRLIKAYFTLKKMKILGLLLYCIKIKKDHLIKNLKLHPNQLFRLDLLKLYYFDNSLKDLKNK